jgi:hypothetical protein
MNRIVSWLSGVWALGFLYLYLVVLGGRAAPLLAIAVAALAVQALSMSALWPRVRHAVGSLFTAAGVVFLSLYAFDDGPGVSVLVAGIMSLAIGVVSLQSGAEPAPR